MAGFARFSWLGQFVNGLLTVEREALTFDPGPASRFGRFSGRLVHRDHHIVVATRWRGPWSFQLKSSGDETAPLTFSPLLTRSHTVRVVLIHPWAHWRNRRVLDAIRKAGFEVEVERSPFGPRALP